MDPELSRMFNKKLSDYQQSLIENASLAYAGDGSGVVNVPGRVGYIYVRIGNSPPVQVFNKRIVAVSDMPVWIGYDPLDRFQLQVLSSAVVQIDNENGYAGNSLTYHAAQHAFLGGDPVFIDKRQVLPGRLGPYASGSASAVIEIQPDILFIHGSVVNIPYQVVDLTSYIPASGSSVYVCVSVSGSGQINITSGSVIMGNPPPLSTVPAIPDGNICLGFVRLYGGMTYTFDGAEYTDFLDTRTMTLPSGGPAPAAVTYLTSGSTGGLANYRRLAAGANVTLTDYGSGSTLVISATGGSGASGSGAPPDAPYVTAGSASGLSNYRRLAAGANITLTDNGSGSTLVVASSGSTLSPFTAKGDIIVGVSAGSGVPHALGSTGYILAVSSGSEVDGVRWQANTGHHIKIGVLDTIDEPNLAITGDLTYTDGGLTTALDFDKLTQNRNWSAKGDLFVATGSKAAGRHGVGTDGTVLVADSSKTDGVDWKNANTISPNAITVTKNQRQMRSILLDSTLAAAGVFDLQNIDQTYDHLEIILRCRANTGGATNIDLRFNNDGTQANYRSQTHYVINATQTSGSFANSYIGFSSDSAASASQWGEAYFLIEDYTKTDKYKSVAGKSFAYQSNGNHLSDEGTLQWASGSSVNRIQVGNSGQSNFAIGTHIQVIGIKTEQVVTDVQGASGMTMFGGTQLFRQVLTGNQSSFDLQSIPAGYDYLEIIINGRSSSAANFDTIKVACNNDTTDADYTDITFYGGTSHSGSVTHDRNIGLLGGSGYGNSIGQTRILISGYDGTTFVKEMKSQTNDREAAATGYVQFYESIWDNTAAINRLTFTLASGSSFLSGTSCSIQAYKNMVTPVGQSAAYVGTQLLRRIISGSPVTSIDLQAIPTGYDRLDIHLSGRSMANGDDYLYIAFNNDTTAANYRYAYGSHGTATSGSNGSDRYIGEFAGPTYISQVDITINDPTESAIQRNAISLSQSLFTSIYIQNWGLNWLNSAPINQITLTLKSGSGFDVGTVITVVGHKNTLLAGGSIKTYDYICVADQKAQNTAGGTFNGGAWRTRDLNTTVSDNGGYASLASNQVTLPPGTYITDIKAPAYNVGFVQARLQNITSGSTLILGQSGYSGSYVATPTYQGVINCTINGRFTLSAASTLEVQQYCSGSQATNGFGMADNLGVETYTMVQFWKEVLNQGGSGGHVIMNQGTGLYPRTNLDFSGSGVKTTDVSANDKTLVTIPGVSGDPIWTTKGDLVAASGSVSGSRVPVGTVGQVLISDPSSGVGVSWVDSLNNGWINPAHTWVYISGSTVRINTDVTVVYPLGCKAKWNDGGQKYAYITAAAVASGSTTLTLMGDAVANSAISANFYSLVANPGGFPHWFAWVTTGFQGFSTAPTSITSRFAIVGRRVDVMVTMGTPGISSGSTFTMAGPIITAANSTGRSLCRAYDNGAYQTAPGYVFISAGTSTISLQKDFGTGGWTASGSKSALFNASYEF